MSNDTTNELFELCKGVYRAEKWGRMDNATPTDFYYRRVWKKDDWQWEEVAFSSFEQASFLNIALNRETAIPIYTSDYLLEKLPHYFEDDDEYYVLKFCTDNMRFVKDGKVYDSETAVVAYYGNEDDECDVEPYKGILERQENLLRTLLKLTIALHEAGELK